MTYTGGEFSYESLWQELQRQVHDENVKSLDQYKDLVDLLVEEKRGYGFLRDEEDLQQIKSNLISRWREFHH